MLTSRVKCSWVKCTEGFSNRVPNVIRTYVDYTKFADFIIVYMFLCFVCFCLIL